MNSILKSTLIVAGLGLLLYGIYTFIQPEASLDVLGMSIEEQNNSEAYITMALGLGLALIGGLVKKK